MTHTDAEFEDFVSRLRRRLASGGVTYGEVSFTRPPTELVDEVQQELEDVCGWALILWVRLDRLRARLADATGGGDARS